MNMLAQAQAATLSTGLENLEEWVNASKDATKSANDAARKE